MTLRQRDTDRPRPYRMNYAPSISALSLCHWQPDLLLGRMACNRMAVGVKCSGWCSLCCVFFPRLLGRKMGGSSFRLLVDSLLSVHRGDVFCGLIWRTQMDWGTLGYSHCSCRLLSLLLLGCCEQHPPHPQPSEGLDLDNHTRTHLPFLPGPCAIGLGYPVQDVLGPGS